MMLHRHFITEETPAVSAPVEEKPIRKPKKSRKGNEEKVAVYIATRNWYKDLVTSAKSLMANSDVDRVFFLIEDDEFPYRIPMEIEIVNASGHEYFPVNSPNYNSHFSYLCVNRAAYAHIFQNFDRILSLDTDLVVVNDISDLWDVDITDYHCAGVIDRGIGTPNYYNAGVILMNLKSLRDNGVTDRMIRMLNSQRCRYIDQDALNVCCEGKILELPLRYNESPVTGSTDHPAIVHYVGVDKVGGSNAARRHFWNRYAGMTWELVKELRKDRYGKSLRI